MIIGIRTTQVIVMDKKLAWVNAINIGFSKYISFFAGQI